MKFLYIYIGNIHSDFSGAAKKVRGIVSELEKRKVEYFIFALSDQVKISGVYDERVYLVPAIETDQVAIYSELGKFLTFCGSYDACVFRYPFASKELVELLKRYPDQITLEHNNKELIELWRVGLDSIKEYKFRPSPSYMRLLRNSLLPVFNELRYGVSALKLAKSGIAVTNEIAGYEKNRFSRYRCRIVGNGIDFSKIKFHSRIFSRGDVLTIVMLNTSNVSWHGVDLILESFRKANTDKFHLILIGRFSEKDISLAQSYPHITYRGFLAPDEINEVMGSVHIGLGAVALFRKKLHEASTLKVREYLASGLPLILGHVDSDVDNNSFIASCRFKIDMLSNSISWEKIYDWAVEVYRTPNINQKIRDTASEIVGFERKVSDLLNG
ncbi:MAG: hypothetical protein H0W50_11225 [Parachlamydiaceae bacterium]|nr:hypothetical protein [Parachlamydiaceae bacterium]